MSARQPPIVVSPTAGPAIYNQQLDVTQQVKRVKQIDIMILTFLLFLEVEGKLDLLRAVVEVVPARIAGSVSFSKRTLSSLFFLVY